MNGSVLPGPAAPARPPSLEQWLAAVPICNQAVRVEACGEAVVLWVPLRRPWWLGGVLRWLLPLRSEKGIALDLVGSAVWRDCDGERQVSDVVAQFAERQRLGVAESRLPVLTFLRSLCERKLLVLALPAGSRSESA